MKLIDAILLSLAADFIIIGIHQTIDSGLWQFVLAYRGGHHSILPVHLPQKEVISPCEP
jgi:hypothetical protein